MSFLETVERARAFLERNGRVSLRALQREFNLDDDGLGELIEELVEIQRVAVRDGSALAWAGGVPPAPAGTPEHDRDPRNYTPKHLADKILTSRSALEGERKHVTVLFADVPDSVPLAANIGADEMHVLMDRCFECILNEVHRYEGTVNQFTGDGVMALFGAPLALEDAPRRAVLAALGIQHALEPISEEVRSRHAAQLRLRIGIHTGPVVVGKIGDDLRMDYTAVGDTTNLANRLQGLARPGAIVISSATEHLVRGFFELRDLGPAEVRGKAEPVGIFEALAARAVSGRLGGARPDRVHAVRRPGTGARHTAGGVG